MYYATYENRGGGGGRSVTEYSGDLVCGGDVRCVNGAQCGVVHGQVGGGEALQGGDWEGSLLGYELLFKGTSDRMRRGRGAGTSVSAPLRSTECVDACNTGQRVHVQGPWGRTATGLLLDAVGQCRHLSSLVQGDQWLLNSGARTGRVCVLGGGLQCVDTCNTGQRVHVQGLRGRITAGLLLDAVGQCCHLSSLVQGGQWLLNTGARIGRVCVLGDGLQIEFVLVALPMHFVDDLLVVVVADGTAELVVVHAGFAFANAPQHGNCLRVEQLELPVAAHPGNDVTVLLVLQQLQQKLPQLNGSCRR